MNRQMGLRHGDNPRDRARASGRWWPLAVLALATIMVVIDTTVMIVALPSAQKALSMSDATRQWVVTAYTVAYGGLLLLGGRLGDRIGRRRALLVGVAGFATTAAIGGAAVSAEMLLGARALEGAFGAVLVSSTRALLVTIYTDEHERATALGVFGAALVGGLAVGSVVGGLLANYLSWRWCLYVNVPIAVIAGIGALSVLPDLKGHDEIRLDILGAMLACASIGLLVYGLSDAASTGWRSGRVILVLATAVVSLAVFLGWQARVQSPLLPLRILTDRNHAGSFIALALSSFGNLGVMLILTYQLQVVLHDSPLIAGMELIPFAVAVAISSAGIAPRLMPHLPPRYLITPGLALGASGFLLLTQLTPASSYLPLILAAEVVAGLGSGLIAPPSLDTALTRVADADTGAAAAMSSTSNQIGGSIGAALLNTIAVGATASYLAATAPAASTTVATIYGYTVALAWGARIELIGALIVFILIDVGSNARRARRR